MSEQTTIKMVKFVQGDRHGFTGWGHSHDLTEVRSRNAGTNPSAPW